MCCGGDLEARLDEPWGDGNGQHGEHRADHGQEHLGGRVDALGMVRDDGAAHVLRNVGQQKHLVRLIKKLQPDAAELEPEIDQGQSDRCDIAVLSAASQNLESQIPVLLLQDHGDVRGSHRRFATLIDFGQAVVPQPHFSFERGVGRIIRAGRRHPRGIRTERRIVLDQSDRRIHCRSGEFVQIGVQARLVLNPACVLAFHVFQRRAGSTRHRPQSAPADGVRLARRQLRRRIHILRLVQLYAEQDHIDAGVDMIRMNGVGRIGVEGHQVRITAHHRRGMARGVEQDAFFAQVLFGLRWREAVALALCRQRQRATGRRDARLSIGMRRAAGRNVELCRRHRPGAALGVDVRTHVSHRHRVVGEDRILDVMRDLIVGHRAQKGAGAACLLQNIRPVRHRCQRVAMPAAGEVVGLADVVDVREVEKQRPQVIARWRSAVVTSITSGEQCRHTERGHSDACAGRQEVAPVDAGRVAHRQAALRLCGELVKSWPSA